MKRRGLVSSLVLFVSGIQTVVAGESGFIEDSRLTLKLRNFYAQQWARRDSTFSVIKGNTKHPVDQRKSWVQGTMLDLRSGWTQGAVGLGVDVSLYGAAVLERGKAQVAGGGDRVLVRNNGEPVDDWSDVGVADLRLRAAGTQIKAGRFSIDTPVLRPKDNRALPPTFDGAQLVTTDLPGMTIQAAWFERVVGRTSSDAQRFVSTYGNRDYAGGGMALAGVDSLPWHGMTASLYFNRFEDVWDRWYAGLAHSGSLGSWGVGTRIALYRTRDEGTRQLGYLENSSASLAETFSHGPHQLSVGYQQVFGNEFYDYPQETVGSYNPVQFYSDFNGPNEKAAMVKYAFNMARYGVPGLTVAAWYARGWDIDGTHYDGDRNGAHRGYAVRGLDDARHWESGLSAGYVLQSGVLKGSSLRTTWYHHRASGGQVDGSYDEMRLVTTLPFELF
jgi:hypothetical protein